MLPTITTPPMPTRIPDPENSPQFIPDPNNPGGPQIVNPAHPGGMMEDRAETIIWEGQLKSLTKRREKFAECLMTAFATYWDQCSLTVRGNLEQLHDWDIVKRNKGPVILREEIRNIACGREAHQEPVFSMCELMKLLINFRQ